MRALRRITLVVLSGATLAVACLPHDCKGTTVVFAGADEGCPSSKAAEEGLEDGTVDQLNGVEVIVPGTLCWYPATFSNTRECAKLPTRAAEVEALSTRTFPAGMGRREPRSLQSDLRGRGAVLLRLVVSRRDDIAGRGCRHHGSGVPSHSRSQAGPAVGPRRRV